MNQDKVQFFHQDLNKHHETKITKASGKLSFSKKNTILHFKDHCTKINISLIVIRFFCSQTFKQTYNPGQNIWNKLEKSSKIGQKKESLITTFACFLTAIAKV